MIEDLVWQAVSDLLRHPQVLLEQYQQRQEVDYGTLEQQEQQRLKRRLASLQRENQRLIDAYQAGIIELHDLKERREWIAEECRRLEERWSALEQQQREQQRQAALATTAEEFCRNISTALDNPSFATKQKILRLVVERVEFVEDQITIKHVIPISDVRCNVINMSTQRHSGFDLWCLSKIYYCQSCFESFRSVIKIGSAYTASLSCPTTRSCRNKCFSPLMNKRHPAGCYTQQTSTRDIHFQRVCTT